MLCSTPFQENECARFPPPPTGDEAVTSPPQFEAVFWFEASTQSIISIILHPSLPSQYPFPWCPYPQLPIRAYSPSTPSTVIAPIASPLRLLPIKPLLLPVPELQLIEPLVSVHRGIIKVVIPAAHEPLPQEVFPRGTALLLGRRSRVR